MANPAFHHTYIPLSGDPEAKDTNTWAPIHIITNASQLPKDFSNPSSEKHVVIGFDCEAVNHGRHGRLCVLQLAFQDAVYIVDVIEGGDELMRACKPGPKSYHVSKIIHDCKKDSEAMFYQYGIKLNGVVDTHIAYALIDEQEGNRMLTSVSFVKLLADRRYCGVLCKEKKEVRGLRSNDPLFWSHRPLTEFKVRAAVDDVRFMHYIHSRMMEKLNERTRWHLAVRGALHCRSFYQSDEEEVSIVLDVPVERIGQVIGKHGATISLIKESCNNVEIIVTSNESKVFIIGMARETQRLRLFLGGVYFMGRNNIIKRTQSSGVSLLKIQAKISTKKLKHYIF